MNKLRLMLNMNINEVIPHIFMLPHVMSQSKYAVH